MSKIKFSKDHISIQKIGLRRFWAGVVAGLFSSVSLSLAFNYTREVYRFVMTIDKDLLILEPQEFLFYDIFFASLAASLGLSITIWIWMINNNHTRNRKNKSLASTYSLLSFWVFFGVVARFGTNLPIMLHSSFSYDKPFSLMDDFRIIFILIPVVTFLQSWLGVRLAFRTGKWISFSFIVCVIMTLVLFKTTGVNRDIVNKSYFLRFEDELSYINNEVLHAKKEYGISYDEKTINALKKNYTESSLNLVEDVKFAFEGNSKVNLDTIILQKIIFHNLKEGYPQYVAYSHLDSWRFALPIEILNQIYLHGPGTPETKELFNTLNMQITLANISINYADHLENKNSTNLERQRLFFAKYRLNDQIIDQLTDVLKELKSMSEYRTHVEKLDELKYKD
jgi:hypothetical protein